MLQLLANLCLLVLIRKSAKMIACLVLWCHDEAVYQRCVVAAA